MNSHIPQERKGHLNSTEELKRVLYAKIGKGNYEAKLELHWFRRVQIIFLKQLTFGRLRVFSGRTHFLSSPGHHRSMYKHW